MTDTKTLRFLDDYELSCFLVLGEDGYYIDEESRGSRENFWMFRRFDDAEKYMLFLISQEARPGDIAIHQAIAGTKKACVRG
ncbi:hypothetical protein L838_0703 [Mycobacterium avium MAV_120709_2344]|nr:hypothetical protein L838_0703 [Mycobacterium avium MAV_120709_2344]